ncbi:MAG: hypothetical protein AAF196_02910 [Planctomycetota bacterium]
MEAEGMTQMVAVFERLGFPGLMLFVFAWLGKRFVEQNSRTQTEMVKSMQQMKAASEHHEERSAERHQELIREQKEVARELGRLCSNKD